MFGKKKGAPKGDPATAPPAPPKEEKEDGSPQKGGSSSSKDVSPAAAVAVKPEVSFAAVAAERPAAKAAGRDLAVFQTAFKITETLSSLPLDLQTEVLSLVLSHFKMRHPALSSREELKLSSPARREPSKTSSKKTKAPKEPSVQKDKPSKKKGKAPKEQKEKKVQEPKAPKERSSEEEEARASLGRVIDSIKKASLELGAVLPEGHPLLKEKAAAIAAIKLARSKN